METKPPLSICIAMLALALSWSACAGDKPASAPASSVETRATVEFAVVADAKSPPPAGSRTLEYKGRSFTLEPARRFDIESTSLTSDAMGYPAIGFAIVPEQKADFTRWTGERVGRNLAVMIDGEIVMLVTIASALPGTGVIISGTQSWSEKDARELASRIAPTK
jgi:preprotein translocase subunit SecD